MEARREVDKTEHLRRQGSNTFQHLEDVRNRPALQSSGAGIQPHEVKCESPFIGVGFGLLAPLGGLRLLYDTKLQQCLSLRANHSLVS